MKSGPLCIPAVLCGRHSAVVRKWRGIAKRAVACGSVMEAVRAAEFISLDDAPGQLILDGDGGLLVEGDNVLLYPVINEIHDAAYASASHDWHRWAQTCRSLVIPALDEFWFALACLGGQSPRVPLTRSAADETTSLLLLKKILRWWPEFCKLDDRFSNGIALPQNGYRWGRVTWDLVRSLGMDTPWIRELQVMDPEDAQDRFIDLIVSRDRELRRRVAGDSPSGET